MAVRRVARGEYLLGVDDMHAIVQVHELFQKQEIQRRAREARETAEAKRARKAFKRLQEEKARQERENDERVSSSKKHLPL